LTGGGGTADTVLSGLPPLMKGGGLIGGGFGPVVSFGPPSFFCVIVSISSGARCEPMRSGRVRIAGN
jgi:hypothetical protein